MSNLGVQFPCRLPPERLVPWARAAEAAGFDEFWIVEDCFFGAGISSVTAALAATTRISVGLGIVPAVARNAAFTALEFATVARLFPDRFLPGIGHGMADWMRQIGAFPSSQLAALEEVTVAVRGLLAGERVSISGSHVHLDRVRLEFPPEQHLQLSLGVRGARSLALSGRVADGTILAEGCSTDYIEWARTQIGASGPHRMTAFAWWAPTHDEVRPIVAAALAAGRIWLEPGELLDAVNAWRVAGAPAGAVPDDWVDEFALVGPAFVGKHAAIAWGVDTVVLTPVGAPPMEISEVD